MNDDSILGNTVGQFGGVIKKTAQELIKNAGDMVEKAGEQASAKAEPYSQADKRSAEIPKVTTGEVVDGFYAIGSASTVDSESKKQIADKSEEEQKKLAIRQKLLKERHKETYYDPTFNPPKKEERPAEKVEREHRQEMQEVEQKEAQKPSPLVQRARERSPTP